MTDELIFKLVSETGRSDVKVANNIRALLSIVALV